MEKPIIVLAIGGAGCRMLSEMREMPEKRDILPLAIDTDRRSLRETGLPESNVLLAAESWRNGRGCGGNVLDGQRAIAHERTTISAQLKAGSMVVIIGGLGGGTASGGIPVVLSEAAKLHLPTFCILSMPFAMEGSRRSAQAEKALNENIYSSADAVVALPNDLLFSSLDEKTPLADAFRLADQEMSRTILSLTAILTSGNLFSSSFSDLVQLLQAGHSRCAIGVGIVNADVSTDRINAAVETLLQSPMLGGAERLSQADAVIFSVIGGPELSLREAKTAMDLVSKYTPGNGELFTGAATSELWRGMLQISALAIKYDERANERGLLDGAATVHHAKKNSAKDSNGGIVQGTLNFDDNKKGVMEGTVSVSWNGEDLDIPAYKRRGCPITGGKVVRRSR